MKEQQTLRKQNPKNKIMINKLNLGYILVLISFIAISFFYKGRKSLDYVHSYSINYCNENKNKMKELENYVRNKDFLNDSIISLKINFYFKSQSSIRIIRFTKNGRFDDREQTPEFLKTFFRGNKLNTLGITKEGIEFINIFRTWGNKKCSLKYFYLPHNLAKNMVYNNKYNVVENMQNDNSEFCCIIDEKCILLIKNDE